MSDHQNLSHLGPGDNLAIKNHQRWMGHESNEPRVAYKLLTVTRTTATLIEAENSGRSLKIRKADGKLVGQDYEYAIEATPELIAEHRQQVEVFNRHQSAAIQLADLYGKERHQLNLTTEQSEALATAWESVKAMKTPTATTEKP